MDFRYKEAYLKRFDRFSWTEKELIISADKQIRDYYAAQTAPYGLRIKKLYASGRDKVLEARVSDKIRIVWIESEKLVSFALVGNHDEVRNYIKGFR